MTAYLIEHPPAQRQFRERGTTPSGVIVVHTAENVPDWVDQDTGAEGVARFIQGRSDFGSYHWLVDSDSIILMVPLAMQAYGDGTGSNPHAVHVSAATQAHRWKAAPADWRRETVANMAEAAARTAKALERAHGIKVPARRITRAQSDARVPGFISHAERDPERRSDPGPDFPWGQFLDDFAEAMAPDRRPTRNISAALAAEDDDTRKALLRKVVRQGTPEAQEAATLWLRGLDARERGWNKIARARKALKRLEVKD